MKYISLFLLLCFYSCGEKICCTNLIVNCYSFDVRQCQTDSYADAISENGSKDARESSMKMWLTNEGFEIDKVKLVENFHDEVCEACDSCPQGDRYFIKLIEQDSDVVSIVSLRFLNYQSTDCAIFN